MAIYYRPVTALFEALLVVTSIPLCAEPVTIDGREWRQVTETIGPSYNEIAGVCNASSGVCSGTFADIDFNGWTWASIEDVAELFSTFTLNPVTLDSVYDEVDSAWAPAFLDMFTPTYADGAFEIAWGLTRDTFETQSGETNAYAPQIMNAWNTEFPDRASLQNSFPLDLTTMFLGSWLHREAVAPVPLPGALGLLGVATALLGALRRRATCAF